MIDGEMRDQVVRGGAWKHLEGHHLLSLGNEWYSNLAELQSRFAELTSEFWRENDGLQIMLPLTTGAISSPMGLGSDSSPVKFELEGLPTYLADSMQFMLEYGCRLTEKATYYIMPSFRGEAVDQSHLSQFFHSEAEIIGGLDDVMAVVEKYVRHLGAGFLESHEEVIVRITGGAEHIRAMLDAPTFRKITFAEAVEILGGFGVKKGEGWRTLTREGEQRLMQELGEFIWLTKWDHLAVPFYQAFADGPGSPSLNGDLLFGIGEVVGAGERHQTAWDAVTALNLHKVEIAPYQWYLDMRDREPLRTAGFGMGIERFFLWLLQHDDIRDMQLIPRENGQQYNP
jgi:asparaginase like protein 1-like protein